MDNKNGWDWRWLYFTGTVLLRMSEREFWRCTPRKLQALTMVYGEFKAGSSSVEDATPTGFIDQIF